MDARAKKRFSKFVVRKWERKITLRLWECIRDHSLVRKIASVREKEVRKNERLLYSHTISGSQMDRHPI